MVKRYISIDEHGYSCAEECQHGDLVDYGDYAALAERCERLEADARRYNTLIGTCTAFIHNGAIGRDTLFRSDRKETWDSVIDLLSENKGYKE